MRLDFWKSLTLIVSLTLGIFMYQQIQFNDEVIEQNKITIENTKSQLAINESLIRHMESETVALRGLQ